MKTYGFKSIITVVLSFVLIVTGVLTFVPAKQVSAKQKTVTICIDPGHGGENKGVEKLYDGAVIAEKDLNLRIAMYLWAELNNYENVKVVMTRIDDSDVGIKQRVDIAKKHKADYIISIHNNQAGDPNDKVMSGSMVLLPVSHYQVSGARSSDIYGDCTKLGSSIMTELRSLGLGLPTDFDAHLTGGLVRRPMSMEWGAKKDTFYPDGSYSDYYGLIRNGVYAGIPTIIIEHAYVGNEKDYRTYLKDDISLYKLALADAQGIANALGLQRKAQ